jgi:hypothetical protein
LKAVGAPTSSRTPWDWRFAAVYGALLIGFVVEIGRSCDPQTGFSSLIEFGDRFAGSRLPQLREVPLYTYAQSSGYDGQFYAQLAVAKNPFDPALARALDSPGYRTRRILFPALVHLLGLGRPAWIIQVYALSNLLCLLILAALLAGWWFPPTDLHNLLRWGGTLFGSGMALSVTRSLTDGPALLAIAVGAHLVEKNRRGLGAVVLAAAGLVRETSVLCAAAFAPTTRDRRDWARAALAGVICVAPTLLWAALLSHRYGGAAGIHNFDLPFVSVGAKLIEVYRRWRLVGFDFYARTELLAVVALATQAGFVLLRPRIELVWWRIGAAFAALWIFLGWAVWEGAFSSATRALLPLTLAFNVLAPRTRRGLVLLLAGNMSVLSIGDVLEAIPTERTTFDYGVTSLYHSGWHEPEHLGRDAWRWASGSTSMLLHNPTPWTLRATLDFQMVSVVPRVVTLHAVDRELADLTVSLAAQKRVPGTFGPVPLPPGDTTIVFTTAEAPWVEPGAGGRALTLSVHNLVVAVTPAAPRAGP